MIPMLTILPIMQLVVLSFAADFEVKNLNLAVVDRDNSIVSRALVKKFTGSGYFHLEGNYLTEEAASVEMERGNADLILVFPYEFEKDLYVGKPAPVQVLINAVNNQKAGIAGGYVQQVVSLYNKERQASLGVAQAMVPLDIRESYWYNPTLNYKTYMVPGILAVLVTMLTAFLTAINIIREREIGTIEQLNVTPLTKFEFILGKLVPFWIIGMFIMALGLTVAHFVFQIAIVGSVFLLFAFCAVYIIAILGIGMLVSTVTETQQQAMFITWFFMVIFILLSGLFTPIDSIPQWAQAINIINPIKYFVQVMRLVMLKGSGLNSIGKYFFIVGGFAVLYNLLAVLSYRKRVG